FSFQAEDGIRDRNVTGVQTCALPISTPGRKFRFSGIPTFAPEHFARVSARDSMKRKQFVKGTEQIAQEGAIQIFKVPGSGMEEEIGRASCRERVCGGERVVIVGRHKQ